MHSRIVRPTLAWVLMVFGLFACASERPVLSANEKLRSVGRESAERDIDACIEQVQNADGGLPRRVKDAIDVAATVTAGAAANFGEVPSDDEMIESSEATPARMPADQEVRGTCFSKGCARERELTDEREAVNACLSEQGYRVVVWRR